MKPKHILRFTGKEKNGIFMLFCLIIGVCIGRLFLPKRQIDTPPEVGLVAPAKVEKNYTLNYFDPNTADSFSLSNLGLEARVIKSIVNYRNKGGRFRTPEDLSKIYGLSTQKFEELRSYIHIYNQENHRINHSSEKYFKEKPFYKKSEEPTFYSNKSFPKEEKHKEGIKVDISDADTTELKKIPGIGSAYAKRIIKYRQLLGGFSSVEQIKEVYGVTPEMYEKISVWMKIESFVIQQIIVNKSSLDKLKSHPYINFYQAKAIIELKNKKGKLQNIEELSLLEEFTSFDLQRLKPYLNFE